MNRYNSTLRAGKPLRRSRLERGTKPMNKIGPKGKAWGRARRELKTEFEARGITTCEFRISPHCTPDNFRSFAHSKKRRFITTEEDLKEAALACFNCHQILDERMTHEQMLSAVREVIAKRAA